MNCPLNTIKNLVTESGRAEASSVEAPLWSMGFRPFFLAASMMTVVLIAMWGLHLAGWLFVGQNMLLWHAHEMVFGYVMAVVAGFLLTATQNWTGRRGVHGRPLMALVGLWFLARLVFLLPFVPGEIVAVVDLLFLPLLAFFLWPYLSQGGRNRVFVVLLAGLWMADLCWHGEVLGICQNSATSGLALAVRILVFMMVLIGGRIIPFFTGNVVKGAGLSVWPKLEKMVMFGTAVYVIAGDILQTHFFGTVLSFFLFAVHLLRWLGWKPWETRRIPILWVLFSGYFWIVIGFFLKALADLNYILPSVAVHAFTAGAMGVLIYGMITRVSLGHTGRPLQVTPLITLGYVLINLAALSRTVVPAVSPVFYEWGLFLAVVFWVMAHLILVGVYWPIWTSPRISS